MNPINKFKIWLKTSKHPHADKIFKFLRSVRSFEVKAITGTDKFLYNLHITISHTWEEFTRIFYWTPLFKSRLESPARKLFLYGGMPYVSGPLKLYIGSNTRISGHTSLAGRTTSNPAPILKVGDNVDIGWQTTIVVGTKVIIGDNVRIAGRSFLAGYPGHPLDAERRALGAPCDDHQSKDIILEDDVWLATGANVMAGVTIGKGTIVAAGSMVTRDLPPRVLAAGVPAKVIKKIAPDDIQAIHEEIVHEDKQHKPVAEGMAV